MRDTGRVRPTGWLERGTGVALAVLAAFALVAAVRLGAAAGERGEDLLAELRAGTERRVATERLQVQPLLEAAARGDGAAARREAEAALERLGGNSQLHLLLASLYREQGEPGPALREYRRAVELVRDYTDRRSPRFIGPGLAPWLHEQRAALGGAALADLRFLQRALAGGCS